MKAARIPRTIHQIWLGPHPRPTAMMETWQKNHPDWSCHVWTEETIDYPLRNQAQFDEMKSYGGKADILRYEILSRHGGVYVDADMVCLRPLDPAFLDSEFFAAYENERYRPRLVANGLIGCIPGHPVMEQMIENIHHLKPHRLESSHPAVETGPYAFTDVIEAFDGDLEIYPSHLFYPDHYLSAFYSNPGEAFARHDWYFGHPTLCLAMVIDRDTANLWRSLPRIKPHIGAYRIGIDADGAPASREVIDGILGDLPGEVLDIGGERSSRAWNAVLSSADGVSEFAILADPDTCLYDLRRTMLHKNAGCYEISEHDGANRRWVETLVRTDGEGRCSNWSPQAAGHTPHLEPRVRLECCHLRKLEHLPFDPSQPTTEEALLLDEFERRPEVPEPLFYLGQYFEDIGDAEKAAHYYQMRVEAGGQQDLAWEACFRIVRCLQQVDAPRPEIERALMNAHEMDHTMARPLLELGVEARHREDHLQAFDFLARAAALPEPDRFFYRDPQVRQEALEQLCICAYYAGRYGEGLLAGLEALQADSTIMNRADIIRNISFYLDKVEIRSR